MHLERAAEAEAAHKRRENDAQTTRLALVARHCWIDDATRWLPRVSGLGDPVALGVHPASTVDTSDLEESATKVPGNVPTYIPRDIDAELDRALLRSGFVLLRGDSTAGKSRAAYEAMRRLSDEWFVLVPREHGSLRALVEGGVELRKVVVWLNDLERYLGPGGLDVSLMRRLVGDGRPRVVLLATMRSSEYAKRSLDREQDHIGPERDLLRADRELLDQAIDLELPLMSYPRMSKRPRDHPSPRPFASPSSFPSIRALDRC